MVARKCRSTCCERGDYFGEIGVLEDSTRVATVRAREPVEALKLERGVFRALVNRYPDVRASFARLALVRTAATFLRLHSVFAALPPEGLREMAEAFEPVEADAGETVVRAGRTGPDVRRRGGPPPRRARRRTSLEYAHAGRLLRRAVVLHGGAREATVEALTPCRLLALAPDAVRRLLDGYPEFRSAGRGARRARTTTGAGDASRSTSPRSSCPPRWRRADRWRRRRDGSTAGRPVAEELGAPRGARRPAPRRRRRFPHVYQLDEMDCGAACLAMVTRYFGEPVEPAAHPRRSCTRRPTARACWGSLAAPRRSASRPARSAPRRAGSTELPLPAVVPLGGQTTGSCSTRSARTTTCGSATPRAASARSRGEEFDEKWTGYAALLSAHADVRDARGGPAPTTAGSCRFLRPHRRASRAPSLLALLAGGARAVDPVLTQIVVDDAIPEGDSALLLIVLGDAGGARR